MISYLIQGVFQDFTLAMLGGRPFCFTETHGFTRSVPWIERPQLRKTCWLVLPWWCLDFLVASNLKGSKHIKNTSHFGGFLGRLGLEDKKCRRTQINAFLGDDSMERGNSTSFQWPVFHRSIVLLGVHPPKFNSSPLKSYHFFFKGRDRLPVPSFSGASCEKLQVIALH